MVRPATSLRQWIQWTTIIAVSVLLIPGLRLNARQKKKTPAARKSAAHRRTRHSSRSHHYRRHYTQVRIQPERVTQIQQALVDAGALHETPNGRWDTATRDAMCQYQQENGFSPTGLPEAKPLMKLGLGPHPLPPGLGQQLSTEAESQGDTEFSTGSASKTLKKPASSNP
jgi:Putative peptidoglycan binding domain